MLNRRWWDAAVIAASLAVAVAVVAGGGATPLELAVAALALLVFAAAYVGIARRGLRDPRPWRMPLFAIACAVALALGCAVQPFFAIVQAIAYPLVWVLSSARRPAIAGSAVVALGVFVGFAAFGGILEGGWPSLAALGAAVTTAVFGFAFAIAFGLWIWSVVEYGEERAHLVAELTAAQGELEALSRERGAAAERERLSRDVHDTVAQTLAGLTILAERAGRQLREERTDAAADTIALVERLSREALDEARALVARTAPVPQDSALSDAVERLVARFRDETGLAIDLELRLDAAGSLSRESQLVLLRCLQESLANVRKHAAATAVRVVVEASADGDARLEVSDDGRGFEPSAPRAGFGLDGMSERIALAGGNLEVTSAPRSGTTLVVRLPAAPAGQAVTG